MNSVELTPDKLVRFREEAGWNQSEGARRFGLSRSGLIRLEKGERKPSASTMKRIREALVCSTADLVKGEPRA